MSVVFSMVNPDTEKTTVSFSGSLFEIIGPVFLTIEVPNNVTFGFKLVLGAGIGFLETALGALLCTSVPAWAFDSCNSLRKVLHSLCLCLPVL